MASRRDVVMQANEELVERFERELEEASERGARTGSSDGWTEPYCASGKMHSF